MSDRPRRRRIDSNEFSGEYLRRRDIYYTEILDIQDQLFRVRESENISRKETLRDDQVTNVRSKLEIWGARLTMMAEEMRNAPLVDDSEAPEAQMSDAMEVDET
ncbi:hypothetical protein FJTKL_13447 [Diaporthe vaccinii]|uniref:Uncharacterized protein n=1 Tax=Diaporthe vaccinii TaxID=105482 RepID=A0ABR4EAA5_9PEZI